MPEWIRTTTTITAPGSKCHWRIALIPKHQINNQIEGIMIEVPNDYNMEDDSFYLDADGISTLVHMLTEAQSRIAKLRDDERAESEYAEFTN